MFKSEAFSESNQEFAVNLTYAIIIWLFSVTVFLPLARVYAPRLYSALAILLTLVLAYPTIKALRHSGPIVEYFSAKISSWINDRRSIEKDGQAITLSRTMALLKATLLLLLYLAYRPLLSAVNPALAGLALVFIILGILKIVLIPNKHP